MTLPFSRNRTYANGDPIDPGDLNDLQDQIIGGKHANQVLALPASIALVQSGSFSFTSAVLTIDASSQRAHVPVPLKQGDRIRSVDFVLTSNASPTVRLKKNNGGTVSIIDTLIGAGVNPTLSGVDYTLASGDLIFLEIETDTSSEDFDGAFVTFDRP